MARQSMESESVAAHLIAARKRKNRRRFGLVLQALLLAVALTGLYVWSKVDMIHFEELEPIKVNKLTPETEERLKGFMTIALFGSDNRTQGDYSRGNSDTIIIAAINNDTKEVRLMSVYRDTLLDMGGGNLRKCNYAYNVGGVQNALEMLNRNLDMDIQDYAAVDFKALADTVDILGGLELTIDQDEAYTMNNSYIPFVEESVGKKSSLVSPGTFIADGVQVVSYCRVRYTSGNDFKRTERQRTVLKLLADKLTSMNVKQANDVINAVFPEISTNLNLADILGLASAMRDYTIADQHGFPFAFRTGTVGDRGSCVVPCTLSANNYQAHVFLYGNLDYTPSDQVTSISNSIVNYTGWDEDEALDYGY